MFVRVVELYRQGERRPNAEVKAAEPLVGWLETWRDPRKGRLHVTFNGRGFGSQPALNVTILHPLFDPGPAKIGKGSMTIEGTQIATRDGTTKEYAQAWWIRLLEDQAADTPTSDPHYHPECSKMIGDDRPLTKKGEPSVGAWG